MLYGRAEPMHALQAALDAALEGRGQLALISGEPGIGKSALASAVAEAAEARGAAVTWGRAWELADAPPYFPLWPCLRAHGVVVGASDDAFHLWEEVLEALARTSRERASVWVLEDLHAADLGTLDLLTFLAQPLRALRVLVVATTRAKDPRLTERMTQRITRMARDGVDIRLEPLVDADVAAIAEEWTGQPLGAPALQRLVDLTGGNPLFVVECARAFRAAGAAGAGGIASLPPTVRQVVMDRVALLPESARAALGCGAVVGREFSAAVVAHMQSALPAQVIDALLPAMRAGIVSESRPGRFELSHVVVQEAILGGMTASERTRLHARAAEALEPLGDGVEVLVERARHALLAMDSLAVDRLTERGYELALRAAKLLEEQGAYDRAFAVHERIEAARSAGLAARAATPAERLHFARIAQAAGRYSEMRRICDEVIMRARVARDVELFARAALLVGADLRPGVVDRSLVVLLEEARALVGETSPALACRLLARLAAALQPASDVNVPIEMARRAIASAKAIGDEALVLEVLETAGSALVDYGPLAERIAISTEFRDRALRAGDRPKALRAYGRLALEQLEGGDFDGSDENAASMLAVSAELGHPRFRWRALLVASMHAVTRGRFAESDGHVVEVSRLAGLTDDPALALALAAHEIFRARVSRRDDDVLASMAGLDTLLVSVPGSAAVAALFRASFYARMEDVAATRAELVAVGRPPAHIMEDQGFIHWIAEAYALAGTEEQRREMKAVLAASKSAEFGGGHVTFIHEGPAARMRGLIDASLGDLAGAEQQLRAALGKATTRGHHLWIAQMKYELGNVLERAGRSEEADASWREAAELGERLGMIGLVRAASSKAKAKAAAPPLPEVVKERVTFEVEGETWTVRRGDRVARLKDTRGLQLLARLVERADEEIHVLALASDEGTSVAESNAGDVLDEPARRAYRERLRDLDEETAAAERDADLGRVEKLRRERDALSAELARAVGLGGRARQSRSATERARVNVQRRLRDAIARITESDAELGRFFERAVRTGTYCCFRP